jgi:hypothetical protein
MLFEGAKILSEIPCLITITCVVNLSIQTLCILSVDNFYNVMLD